MTNKILFFDIDGTLIDNRQGIPEVPEGVQRELHRLQSLGHKIFICSGRPKAMINKHLLSLGFDGYILYNGGYIEIDGRSIFEKRMELDLVKNVIKMLEDLHCDYMLETARHIYIDPKSKELYDFFAGIGMEEMFSTHFNKEEVLDRIIKIEANVKNQDKERIQEYVSNKLETVIHFDEHGSDNAFEFFSPNISKAVGINKVVDYYHADIKDTYAFGDGLNDLEMIKACEVGVAMGNAVDELKKHADIICRPINEQGLERVLKILFPN